MTRKKNMTWRITAYGRKFSEDERHIFDKAVELVQTHGTHDAWGDIHHSKSSSLVVGALHIKQVVTNSAPHHSRMGVLSIEHEGQKVFQASCELWKRPRNPGQLTIDCAASIFVRGRWERELHTLKIPKRPTDSASPRMNAPLPRNTDSDSRH